MAKNNLTRHEELRYSYLLSNLQYLNNREKQEFDYLYQKKVTANRDWANNYTSSDGNESYQDYDNYIDQNEFEDNSSYTSQGIPRYPKEEGGYNSTNREYPVNNIPDYQDNYSPYSEPPTSPEPLAYEEPKKSSLKKASKQKKPRRKIKIKRILQVIGALILVLILAMGYMFYKGVSDVENGDTSYKAAVKETFNGKDTKDGTNILILGSDQRVSQGTADARTDTIMVMNVGNKDGKIKLVSFMRDTLVNIKGVSYNDYSNDQKLNVAFNIGEQNNNQGAELMRQTLKNNFDINIKYYVMIDFQTFAEAVNTLFPDGVEINAKFGTINGENVSYVEVPDDLNMAKDGSVPNQTIKEGKQRMDGRTLLNYARFRHDDDGDYGRTTRQQQVITAIVNQIKDPSKLFTGSAAIGKVYALTSTNISYSFLLKEGLSVITSGQKGVEQTTVPKEGDWVNDYDMYGGLGISIDFNKYQEELKNLGMR